MKLSINEILKLDYREDDCCFIEYELLEKIMGFYTLDIFSHDRVTSREYINNLVYYDCRARDLNVICVDSEPTLIYQYIGKGEYSNIFIINQDKLNELKGLILEELTSKEDSLKVVSDDFAIDIQTYGTDIYIKDNKLICNNPKRELVFRERDLKKLLDSDFSEIKAGDSAYIGYIHETCKFNSTAELHIYNDNGSLILRLISTDTSDVIKEFLVNNDNMLDILDSLYDEVLGSYENKNNYKNLNFKL